MDQSRVVSLILAGGKGTRLWPLSRQSSPKQFMSLGDDYLINDTIKRLNEVSSDVIVVTCSEQEALLREVVAGYYEAISIVEEPVPRNTAACILLGVLKLCESYDEETIVGVFPSDHQIGQEEEFRQCLNEGIAMIEKEPSIVLFGVPPTYPATGYGYIQHGDNRVKRFVEKPSLDQALAYLEDDYLWNSGIFLFKLSTIKEQYKRFLPEMYEVLSSSLEENTIRETYGQLMNISFDKGILEHSTDVKVVRATFGWNDIGNLQRLGETWPMDELRNATKGDYIACQSENNIIYSPNKPVALLGVNDLVVINTDDVLLICPKGDTERIGELLLMLRNQGRERLL